MNLTNIGVYRNTTTTRETVRYLNVHHVMELCDSHVTILQPMCKWHLSCRFLISVLVSQSVTLGDEQTVNITLLDKTEVEKRFSEVLLWEM